MVIKVLHPDKLSFRGETIWDLKSSKQEVGVVCVGWKDNSYFQTEKDQFASLKALRTIKQFTSITLRPIQLET